MSLDNNKNLGPVVLLVLDGWGIAPAGEGNAFTQVGMPIFRSLVNKYPATILAAAPAIGLGKKINLPHNYLALGTGKKKLSPANFSLFDYLEQAGLKWLSISDPEKLSYGLFFINNKKKVEAGNFAIVPADKIADELLKKIKSRNFDFILAITADLDLAAHRGDFTATVEAARNIDQALDRVAKTVLDNSGVLLITSTHGNAEAALAMNTELADKKDSVNPVPLVIVGKEFEGKSFGFPEAPGGDLALVPPSGSLFDVTPTILKIMGLEVPDNLDGKPLI
ncbi:MAG: hypothetical protein PHO56_02455 [Patescibacteria group bacterium]|nr:hypothetical protein [Patescibacteria group bacterium]